MRTLINMHMVKIRYGDQASHGYASPNCRGQSRLLKPNCGNSEFEISSVGFFKTDTSPTFL